MSMSMGKEGIRCDIFRVGTFPLFFRDTIRDKPRSILNVWN